MTAPNKRRSSFESEPPVVGIYESMGNVVISQDNRMLLESLHALGVENFEVKADSACDNLVGKAYTIRRRIRSGKQVFLDDVTRDIASEVRKVMDGSVDSPQNPPNPKTGTRFRD